MSEFTAGHQYGFLVAMLMVKKKIDFYLDNLENSGMSEESKKEVKKIIEKIFENENGFDYDDDLDE